MSKQNVVIAPFDAADFLNSEEVIAEFLNVAAEDETPGAFMLAVGAVAKARGMAKVAEDSGLSRESLYKALAPHAQPRFDTVRRVLSALGTELAVIPRNAATQPERSRVFTGRRNAAGVFAKKARSGGIVFAKKAGAPKVKRPSGAALKSARRSAPRSKPIASSR